MSGWELLRGSRTNRTIGASIHKTARERAEALLVELMNDKTESRRKAKGLENWVAFCWWGSITLGALASLGGLLAAVPELQNRLSIKPWHISVLALCASGLVVLRRKTSWRSKSDIFYGRERDIDTLVGRIKYRMPAELDFEHVAEIAKVYDDAKAKFGVRMHAINAFETEPDEKRS